MSKLGDSIERDLIELKEQVKITIEELQCGLDISAGIRLQHILSILEGSST